MPRTRANKEGNIRQRADGRWEVRITIGIDFATGEPKRISRYAATQEEAVKILHELSFLRDTSPKNFQTVTLGNWLDLCLEVYMRNTLKQSTYLSYEGYIRNHYKPALGDLLLRDITPRLLQQFYNYKAEQEGLSPKTIVNMNLFLHKALSYAVNEGYIQTNPAASINLTRGTKPQIEILTRDEQVRLMQGSYQHRYGIFVRLVLFTGIRLGELLGLKWEDVDFASSNLHIRRTLNRLNKINHSEHDNGYSTEIVIQAPKSQNSLRTIPLLPAVVSDLQSWAEIQKQDKLNSNGNYTESGFIVTNQFGGFIEPRTFKDYYNQILKISGLRHFTFHALRHTFASRAMEQGMDAKTLSMILGHYSVAFTLDTYTHVLDDHKHEGIALMDELFVGNNNFENNALYPVVITMQEDGLMYFEIPGIPQITHTDSNIQSGMQFIKESLNEEILTSVFPLHAVPTQQIILAPNQMLMQIQP